MYVIIHVGEIKDTWMDISLHPDHVGSWLHVLLFSETDNHLQ